MRVTGRGRSVGGGCESGGSECQCNGVAEGTSSGQVVGV